MPLAGLGLVLLPELAVPGLEPLKRQVTVVLQPLFEPVAMLQLVELQHHLLQNWQQSVASYHFRLLQLIQIGNLLRILHFCHKRNMLTLL